VKIFEVLEKIHKLVILIEKKTIMVLSLFSRDFLTVFEGKIEKKSPLKSKYF